MGRVGARVAAQCGRLALNRRFSWKVILDVDTNVVRSSPLFADIDPDAVDALIRSMTPLRLERGQVLFREGDPGDRFFIIKSGKIKLGRTASDGRENLITLLGPGEILGELSLFDPGPRGATATAVSETTVFGLGHQDLLKWIEARPAVAGHLLQSLARRLRKTNESMADLVFSDVPGRVAKALLDLSTKFGQPTDLGIRVQHDLTQEELAQLVGASRETVNKALADFVARGWIRLEGRAVVLLDVERLGRRAR